MEFKLSAELVGHEADVRDVVFPSSSIVISVSRDRTVRIWQRKDTRPPTFESSVLTKGQDFVNAVAYLYPDATYRDGLIIAGGKDTLIEARQPGAGPGPNDAERLLVGHDHNVCALDTSPKGSYIVSGSWDKQAIVWFTGKWEPEKSLVGHDASVLGVLALTEETVVTASADEKINIYDIMSSSDRFIQPKSTIHTTSAVRAVAKVADGHESRADIASAHNDGVIRLWKLNGQCMGELHGHESFIYSLASLPTGELVSSGEDRTIRIWRGLECVQTITLPAISVWAVAVCKDTGDIVAGSSDAVARVFTRNEADMASAESLAAFDESVKASSIPQQQVDGLNKEKLPGTEFLKAKSGTKEGQVQMIREDNGSITAHQWSMAQNQWICVGTVVDAVGSSGKKQEYNGQSYDYVFDVDIKEGAPTLKLPYNLSQNPYEAATKFIGDNELSMSYLDQVAGFIVQNTQGATLGQGSGPAPGDFGTGRYQPGDDTMAQQPPGPRLLPQEDYLTLATVKLEPLVKKILMISANMISSGRKDFALNPTEEDTLKRLAQKISTSIGTVPATFPAAGAPTPTDKWEASQHEIGLVFKLVNDWTDNDRIPGLDLLRCLVTSSSVASIADVTGKSVINTALESAFHPSPGASISRFCVMMAFRVIANLFTSEDGRKLAYAQAALVVDYMQSLVGLNDTTIEGPVGVIGLSENRNTLIAVTTAALNYAVLGYMLSRKKVSIPGGDVKVTPEVFGPMAQVMCKIIDGQSDAEVNYRALAALGTLAAAGIGDAMKGFQVEDVVRRASKADNAEVRIRAIASECLMLL